MELLARKNRSSRGFSRCAIIHLFACEEIGFTFGGDFR
jgi:hypothetical protein